MSEQNKATTRRFYEEVFNKKNVNALEEFCAPDIVDHMAMPGQAPGLKGVKDMFTMFMNAFPDIHVNVEEMIAERDVVVARFTIEGTHKGELMGAAPTGRKVIFNGLDMIRIKNGKATEVWHHGDDMIVLMGLGVKPPTGFKQAG